MPIKYFIYKKISPLLHNNYLIEYGFFIRFAYYKVVSHVNFVQYVPAGYKAPNGNKNKGIAMNKSQNTSPKKDPSLADLRIYFIVASTTFVVLIMLSMFYILGLFDSLYNPLTEPNQLALLTLGTIFSFLLAWASAMFTKISIEAYHHKDKNSDVVSINKHVKNSGAYSLIVVMVFLSLLAVIATEMAYLLAVDQLIMDANYLKYGALLILSMLGVKFTNNTHKVYMENIGSFRQ